MLSYHNDPLVKQKYIARFATHRAADAVIQGTGFANGRGCFVGCTLNEYNHYAFPKELGWPIWLAYCADSIFEGLPKSLAPQFGTDLLEAVPVGVDLEPLKWMLAVARMDRLIEQQELLDYPELDKVLSTLHSAKKYASGMLQHNGDIECKDLKCFVRSYRHDSSYLQRSGEYAKQSAFCISESTKGMWPYRSMGSAASSFFWFRLVRSLDNNIAPYQDEHDALFKALRELK